MYGKSIWAKNGMPIEKWIVKEVLFACKYLLVEWGWSNISIWVDLEMSSVSLGTNRVFHLDVTDRILKGTTSTGFEEHTQDVAWQKILKDAQAKIGSMPTKGVGEKGRGQTELVGQSPPAPPLIIIPCRVPEYLPK